MRTQRGLTLVEVMVGVAIGLVILAALSLLFAGSSRSRGETERAGLRTDNGRHALDTLATELAHAGFLGELDPRGLPAPASRPAACASDLATLEAAVTLPVLGHDQPTPAQVASPALACLGGGLMPGTDLLVVRRAATCVQGTADCTALTAGGLGFQASSCADASELGGTDSDGRLRLAAFPGAARFTLRQRDCVTPAPLRRYLVRIYFIARDDAPGDGIPSLKRVELDPGGGFGAPVTLVQGVQDLQVEWGLDSNGDGAVDLYASDPDGWCASASPPVPPGACWQLPVTARLFVLARSVEPSPDWRDTRRYTLGQSGPVVPVAGPFGDGWRREVYARTVALRNVVARRIAP